MISVLIAADTKIFFTDGRDTVYDTITKIRILNNTVVYSIAGIESFNSLDGSKRYFDAFDAIDSCMSSDTSAFQSFEVFKYVLDKKIQSLIRSHLVSINDIVNGREDSIFFTMSLVFLQQGKIGYRIGNFSLHRISKDSFAVKFAPKNPSLIPK